MRTVLLFCLSIVLSEVLSNESDVLVLTDEDFQSKAKQYELLLVEFYAPWCGHCKRLAPEYEKAATILAKNDPPVPLAKVDCTVEKKTCETFGITGFPTLKILKNGELLEEYNGAREANAIANKMRLKVGPPFTSLNSIDDHEKFVENDVTTVVGYFDGENEKVLEEFSKVAEKLGEKFRFGLTKKTEILEKFQRKNEVVIFLAKRFRSKIEPWSIVVPSNVDLKSFIEKRGQSFVGIRTTSNVQDFVKPLIVVYFNVDFERDPKGTNYIRNRLVKLAKKLDEEKFDVRFAISNVEQFQKEFTNFGISNAHKDGKYVLARDEKDRKFKMTEFFSFEAVENFARDFLQGKLEPYVKTQPIPEQIEPVRVVVGKNFQSIVDDPTKDVLIEFYAPWCGHCKSLAPKYEELAKLLANEKDIVIAKIDATENDIPSQYQVRGYPSIFFASKNDKENPKKYEGAREVADFIKYIAQHSTNQLDGYDRDGNKILAQTSKNEEL